MYIPFPCILCFGTYRLYTPSDDIHLLCKSATLPPRNSLRDRYRFFWHFGYTHLLCKPANPSPRISRRNRHRFAPPVSRTCTFASHSHSPHIRPPPLTTPLHPHTSTGVLVQAGMVGVINSRASANASMTSCPRWQRKMHPVGVPINFDEPIPSQGPLHASPVAEPLLQ